MLDSSKYGFGAQSRVKLVKIRVNYVLLCYPEKSTEVDLTSDTLNLASGNLDTLGCLGVSNLPAVDFRVDYRLRAFSSS